MGTNQPIGQYEYQEILDYLEKSQQLYNLAHKFTDDWSFAEIDAIKSSLVTNKIIEGEWNLKKAIAECSHNRETKTKPTLGLRSA